MIKAPVQPNTDEWHAWRRSRCNASEASVIMGEAPKWMDVRTWDDLRAVKAGHDMPPSPWALEAFRHGHQTEARVLEDYPNYAPTCVMMEKDDRFAASIDGLLEQPAHPASPEPLWLEIKAPYSRNSQLRSNVQELARLSARSETGGAEEFRRKLPYIFWQLVHQTAVITEEQPVAEEVGCLLLVQDIHARRAELRLRANMLLNYWSELKGRWEKFLRDDAQYRADEQWVAAAQRYAACKSGHEKSQQLLTEAKDALIELAGGQEVSGSGLRVAKIQRSGTVDWAGVAAQIAAAHGVDPDPIADQHRRPDAESWQVLPHKDSA